MLAPVVKLNNLYAWSTSYMNAQLAVTLKGSKPVDGKKKPERFVLYIKRKFRILILYCTSLLATILN